MKIPAVITFGQICTSELYQVSGMVEGDPDGAPKFVDPAVACDAYAEDSCEPKCRAVPFWYGHRENKLGSFIVYVVVQYCINLIYPSLKKVNQNDNSSTYSYTN